MPTTPITDFANDDASDPAARRSQFLNGLGLLSPEADPVFERAVRLAARLLDTQFATLTFTDGTTACIKAQHGGDDTGLATGLIAARDTYTRFVVEGGEGLVIENMSEDHRFAEMTPLVGGVMGYIAMPLFSTDRDIVGSIAAFDRRARDWSAEDRLQLEDLAELISSDLAAKDQRLLALRTHAQLRTILDDMPVGIALARVPSGEIFFTNRESQRILHVDARAASGGDYEGIGGIREDGTPLPAEEYPLFRTVNEDETVHNEVQLFRRAPHDIRHLEVSSRRIDSMRGSAQIAVATYNDVTQQRMAEAQVAKVADQLWGILEVTDDAVLVLDRNWRITFANDRYLARRNLTRDIYGRDIRDVVPGRVNSPFRMALQAALDTGEPQIEVDFIPDVERWIEARCFPTADELTIFFRDVTEDRRNEEEARALDARLQSILEATTDGVMVLDRNYRVLYRNNTLKQMQGSIEGWDDRPVDGAIIWDVFPERKGGPVHELYDRAFETQTYQREENYFARYGKWTEVRVFPTNDQITVFFRDIDEEKAVEEGRTLLVRELNHRVKNLFAILGGLITMTSRQTDDAREMATALRSRLYALARAHELIRPAITQERPDKPAVLLRELMEALLAPYLHAESKQVYLGGPDLVLGSNGATSMALILHELMTNAAKYGALATPSGTLTVSWDVEDDTCRIDWREASEATGTEQPQPGFGSQLIETSVQAQLRGSLDRKWTENGLHLHIDAKLDRLNA